MTPRDALAHLHDVAQACDLIEGFTDGKSFDDYVTDAMLRSAVERQFEIVGEALKRAISVDAGLEPRIEGAPRIIAFRNRLIHGYATISDEVVWGVVEGSLPNLQREVKALIEELDRNGTV